MIQEVRRRGLDGIICGHIHHADLRMIDGLVYANTGDWAESGTALVEHYNGSLEIVAWMRQRQYQREDILPAQVRAADALLGEFA